MYYLLANFSSAISAFFVVTNATYSFKERATVLFGTMYLYTLYTCIICTFLPYEKWVYKLMHL